MKILITGANGQLGRACQELFRDQELLLGDVDTLDITRREDCRKAISGFQPDVIIHAAAYTNVKGAESDPVSCYQINGEGTYNLALAAHGLPVTFVYISTDFVFDGRATKPYSEDAAVNPLSVYGRSKLMGELIVQDLVPKHFILRTAWLYGQGKNFVQTILALAEKQEELSIVCDQHGTPTSADDLARFIRAVLETYDYGLYHATNSGEASWAEFATEIIKLTGKSNKVIPITTPEAQELLHDPTQRPAYAVLDKSKLSRCITPRSWQEALRAYMSSVSSSDH